MTAPSEQALLASIYDAVTKLSERLAVVETDLKTLIRDTRSDLQDHEARLRRLEAADLVSRQEMEEAAAKRSARFWVIAAVLVTVIIAVVGPIETVVITRLFGQ